MATEVRASQLVVGQDAPSNPPEVRSVSVVVGQDAPSNPPEVRNVALVAAYEQLTGPEVLDQADYYYTAEDITSGDQQTIPNRGTAGPADSFLGPSAAVEPQDPTWASSPRRLVLDGVNDYIQHPAGSNPQPYLTPTSGAYAALVVARPGTKTSTSAFFATSAAPYEGICLYFSAGNTFVATVRDSGSGAVNMQWGTGYRGSQDVVVFGVLVNNGAAMPFTNIDGLGPPNDITALADINFGASLNTFTSTGSTLNYQATVPTDLEWYASVWWHNRMPSKTELVKASEELLARATASSGGVLTSSLGGRRRRIGTTTQFGT